MIIKRLISAPELWQFIVEKLPPGLQLYRQDDGYGGIFGVTIKESKKQFFDWDKPLIANVEGTTIILHHPQYFSDFEQIGMEYEKKYHKEVTLKFYESP